MKKAPSSALSLFLFLFHLLADFLCDLSSFCLGADMRNGARTGLRIQQSGIGEKGDRSSRSRWIGPSSAKWALLMDGDNEV